MVVHKMLSAVFCISLVVCVTDAYPTGAPQVACEQMVPYHPPTTTSGQPPFAINVSSAVYKPGDKIYGTVYSPSAVEFKGLLLEVRQASDDPSLDPIGTFEAVNNGTHTTCGKDNQQALTHSTSDEKTSVDFVWTAPNTPAGNIHFKLTIVESYNVSRYWVRIFSAVVQDCSKNSTLAGCGGPSTPVTTGSSTARSTHIVTTRPAPGKMPYDPECGTKKSCYPHCPDGCDYLVSWQPSTKVKDSVQFHLKMLLNNTNDVWIAFGLSQTGHMDGTNVAACLSRGTVQSSHNNGYVNVLFDNDTLGLSDTSVKIEGQVFGCSFTREKTAADNNFLDLSESYYLLVGTGPVVNETIQMHTNIPTSSPDKIDFLSAPATASTPSPSKSTQTPQSTQPPNKKISFDKDCGSTKGCFPDCPDGCDYLVTWQRQPSDDSVKFSISMALDNTNNIWIAAGLSRTGEMDQTNVAACLTEQPKMSIMSTHTNGHTNIVFSNKTLGLTDFKGYISNGVVSCSFLRQSRMNVTGYWDLSHDMYLLVGTGPVANGAMMMHSQVPYRSDKQINFQSYSVAGESKSASTLIKLHGSLMVVAWLFCSSVGLVVARHAKPLMGARLLCNLKYWFVIHRSLMSLTVLCVIAAFVAIFVERKGFQEVCVPGKAYTSAHPYLGIVVTAMTLLNPIMALFRPNPDSKRRYIFNMAHFSVGTTAHVLAVITVGFGVNLPNAMVHESAKYVVAGYSVAYVLVHVVLELYNRKKKNVDSRICCSNNATNSVYKSMNTVRNEAYDEHSGLISGKKKKEVYDDEGSSTSFLSSVLTIHSLLMLASAAIMVLMIYKPSTFDK